MFREAEVFTLSGMSVHFDRNMHHSNAAVYNADCDRHVH